VKSDQEEHMQRLVAITIVIRGEDGFDWLSAAVGAAATLGLAAVIAGLILLGARSRGSADQASLSRAREG
jgi:hypothetical protein